jgi:hypothetical protein
MGLIGCFGKFLADSVADERGTSNFNKLVAEVTVLADAELLPAVVDFVRRAAHQLGLREKAIHELPRRGIFSETCIAPVLVVYTC